MIIHVSWIVESRGIIYFIVKKNCSWKKKRKKKKKRQTRIYIFTHTHEHGYFTYTHIYFHHTVFTRDRNISRATEL